jgi:hypothetical protein
MELSFPGFSIKNPGQRKVSIMKTKDLVTWGILLYLVWQHTKGSCACDNESDMGDALGMGPGGVAGLCNRDNTLYGNMQTNIISPAWMNRLRRKTLMRQFTYEGE